MLGCANGHSQSSTSAQNVATHDQLARSLLESSKELDVLIRNILISRLGKHSSITRMHIARYVTENQHKTIHERRQQSDGH